MLLIVGHVVNDDAVLVGLLRGFYRVAMGGCYSAQGRLTINELDMAVRANVATSRSSRRRF